MFDCCDVVVFYDSRGSNVGTRYFAVSRGPLRKCLVPHEYPKEHLESPKTFEDAWFEGSSTHRPNVVRVQVDVRSDGVEPSTAGTPT